MLFRQVGYKGAHSESICSRWRLAVKSAPFEYRAAATIEEALVLMSTYGDEARPLAGGQSLVPLMAFRLARPSLLIDLNLLSDLARIESSNGAVRVGTMVRERAAERSAALASSVPLLARALPLIGHEAIRTRGTVGGSMAHCDPAAELPAVALATEATMTVRSHSRGERQLVADEFFVSYFTTGLMADELLIHVTFPTARENTGVSFKEMTRRHGDFAIVGVASILHVTDGTIDHARVVLTGVAERPFRSIAAERVLVGSQPDNSCFVEAAGAAQRELDPPSDLHGTASYRRHVAGVLIRRSLQEAATDIRVAK